ncbi:hypothetical protein LRF89_10535 [Halorhodospira sp. 9621]|uniref:hypothetical protein n=1 Tax=Halorhodospira sp. 9621 TaxID=2899135 RepID=UPI001EE8C7FA|nr:hypothetical protein [Halorhodospira sp. 9621]MCG5533872.1 hypothetical protein [Halorhodospira sp. 9621]
MLKEIKNHKDILVFKKTKQKPTLSGHSNVIVSLTSFPQRIRHAWIPIESIFWQSRRPDKIVLVLSRDEFRGHTIPSPLKEQEKRGLEILWVNKNLLSYKKLLPTRELYPDATIITIDDDIFYERSMLSDLLAATEHEGDAVIGHRGWEITFAEDGFASYHQWRPIRRRTEGGCVLLTGAGGILYPPGCLDNSILLDYKLAARLCPTADDIFFWAVERTSGSRVICLGRHDVRPLGLQSFSPSLAKLNVSLKKNDQQMRDAADYFGIPYG